MEQNWLELLTPIICAIAGSTTVCELIKFFVGRHDSKKSGIFTAEDRNAVLSAMTDIVDIKQRLNEQDEQLHELRVGNTRVQAQNLIYNDPHNHDAINKICKEYFQVLHGNTYMVEVYIEWCKREGIAEEVKKEVLGK